jgi:hypothetical protein
VEDKDASAIALVQNSQNLLLLDASPGSAMPQNPAGFFVEAIFEVIYLYSSLWGPLRILVL